MKSSYHTNFRNFSFIKFSLMTPFLEQDSVTQISINPKKTKYSEKDDIYLDNQNKGANNACVLSLWVLLYIGFRLFLILKNPKHVCLFVCLFFILSVHWGMTARLCSKLPFVWSQGSRRLVHSWQRENKTKT